MTTLEDIVVATDFLIKTTDTKPLYWKHMVGSNVYTLNQPDGVVTHSFNADAPVEAFNDGTVAINGITFTCYVAQQIKFEPTKE